MGAPSAREFQSVPPLPNRSTQVIISPSRMVLAEPFVTHEPTWVVRGWRGDHDPAAIRQTIL
jgi:hypothetical protein